VRKFLFFYWSHPLHKDEKRERKDFKKPEKKRKEMPEKRKGKKNNRQRKAKNYKYIQIQRRVF
jgi:hypothetical protein